MLLPLGSLNAHHNMANNYLFHPVYGFTLGAGSDPLQASARCSACNRDSCSVPCE